MLFNARFDSKYGRETFHNIINNWNIIIIIMLLYNCTDVYILDLPEEQDGQTRIHLTLLSGVESSP